MRNRHRSGPHQLGGQQDIAGPIPAMADARQCHEGWEATLFGIQRVLAARRVFTSHHFRRAIERLGNDDYDNSSYYERWLIALETLVVEHHLVTAEDLHRAQRRRFGDHAEEHTHVMPQRPMPNHPETLADPRIRAPLSPGTRVQLVGGIGAHNRLPDWALGHAGVIRACRGLFPLPDLIVAGNTTGTRYPLYSIELRGADVFPDAHRNDVLYLDAYGPYLTRQPEAAE
jgi:hypothetical protein